METPNKETKYIVGIDAPAKKLDAVELFLLSKTGLPEPPLEALKYDWDINSGTIIRYSKKI